MTISRKDYVNILRLGAWQKSLRVARQKHDIYAMEKCQEMVIKYTVLIDRDRILTELDRIEHEI